MHVTFILIFLQIKTNRFSFISPTEYYETQYYPQYECVVPLLESAQITATSSLRERGPSNARLNGK